MGYFYTDAALFHADKRDKGMNSTTSEKGTDNKRNNSSAYNHEYYMKNKEKWQDNKKSGDAKFAEYQKGDSDFDDANYSEKNRLGDTDFFGFQKPDGSWVILEEDMKWTLPAGMDRAAMIKALEAFDKEMESKRGNYTSKDWQEAANKAINSASKKKSSDSGEKEFDVDAAAMDVIRGKYGNGAERKAALGEDYAEVQKRVNELMKAQNDKKKQMSKASVEPKLTTIGKVDKKYVRHMEADMTNNDWRIYQGDLDYLAHHGIRGQRWGIRRFQNKDGSLKAAGKARYDDKNTNSKTNGKKPSSTKTSAYEKNLTDGKKLLQDMVLGPAGSVTYRMARGVGEGRVKAALRSVFDINLSQIAGVSVGNAAGNIVTNLIGPDSISGQTLGQTAGIAANYSVQEATKDSGLSLQQRALRKKMNGR